MSPSDETHHHTTQAERDRAEAVHSLDDETRVHTDGDDTEQIMGAGGELRDVDDEYDDQDSEPTKNAPDEGRPDLTALSRDDD